MLALVEAMSDSATRPVSLDGVAHAFCQVRDDADLGRLEPGLAVAPASLSLQSIIRLRQTTGHPVLLGGGLLWPALLVVRAIMESGNGTFTAPRSLGKGEAM